MSTPYYLLGPIDFPGPIFLTVNKSKVSYFLTLTSGNELIFDPRVTTPIEVGIDSSGDNVEMTFPGSNSQLQYIGAKSSNGRVVAAPVAKQDTLIPVTTEVNPWRGNVAFLAGVHYSFNTSGHTAIEWQAYEPDTITNGIVETIKMEGGNPVITYFTSDIRALPTRWFEIGSCDPTSNKAAVVAAERLWVTETGQVPNGFTTQSECMIGIRYSYCGPKIDCSNQCKGPCARGDQTCTFDSQSSGTGEFMCVDPKPPKRPIWENQWFWIAIAVAVVVLIIVILLIRF